MTTWRLKGVFASVVTPVDEDGHPLQDVLTELTRFLIDRKVSGLCIGDAVSEYPSFALEERKLIISVAVDAARGRVPILSTISAYLNGDTHLTRAIVCLYDRRALSTFDETLAQFRQTSD